MPNTFNLYLSNFVDSNLNAIYGVDYVVDDLNLVVPLTSTWMQNITSISTGYNGLCSLDLSQTRKLSSITIQDPEISSIKMPFTNTNFLCAAALKTRTLAVTGDLYKFLVVTSCPELSELNVTYVKRIQNLIVMNCPKLSSIYFNPASFVSSVSNIFIAIMDCNLNTNSVDGLYSALVSGTLLNDTPYTDSILTLVNPTTGSSSALTFSNLNTLRTRGFTINLTQTGNFNSNNSIVFATKKV